VALEFGSLVSFLAITVTVTVFLSGFLSVRVHAHVDRAQERYDTLIDRTLETTRVTTSYPRPAEFKRIGQIYDEEMRPDAATRWTLAVCCSAWMFGIAIWAYTARVYGATFSDWQVLILSAVALLLTGVLVVVLVDFFWAHARLREHKRMSLPYYYASGLEAFQRGTGAAENDKKAAQRGFTVATAAFEKVQSEIPRWPWAIFWLARCYEEDGTPDHLMKARDLSMALEAEVAPGSKADHVDDVLLAAALAFRGIPRKDLGDQATLETYARQYPDLHPVVEWLTGTNGLYHRSSAVSQDRGDVAQIS